MLLLLEVGDVQAAVVGVSTADQVYPRLIPVHRVQYNLAVLVHVVVRQLHFFEGNNLFPQLFASEG